MATTFRRPKLLNSFGSATAWGVTGTVAFAVTVAALWPASPADLAAAGGAALIYAAFIALGLRLRRERRMHQASETRRELAEGRLADFAGVSSEWLWEMDRDLRFTWLSPRFEELTGIRLTEVVGRTREEFARPPADAGGEWARHLGDLRARRPFRGFVYAPRRPDGEVRHFQINGDPIFDSSGAFAGYRGTGRDLTALKRAEERLLDAIEAMNDGFVLWDPDDRVVLCNDAFRRMDPESFAALRPGTRFADIMRARVRAGRIPAARGREEEYIRERLAQHCNPTGEPIVQHLATGQWVRIVERRTRDGGIVAIRSDITGLKRQQEELLRAKEGAEAANRAKTRFLATMSHELRTPLNAIIGFSEVMQAGAFGPLGSPKYAEYTAAINASGRHLLTLIGDILDMSRIESGRYVLHPVPLDLGEIAREALPMVQRHAEERGVALANEIDGRLPCVNADRLAVKQILINLLSNAIKFTSPGGRVAVSGRRDAAQSIAVTVADTGIGIAPERLPHLFEPFSGHDDAALTQRAGGGSGLGLSICRRLVRLHGGEITIASEPGRGTIVTVVFPAHLAVDRRSA